MKDKLLPKQIPIYNQAKKILAKYNMLYLALEPRFGKSYLAMALLKGSTLVVTTKSALKGFKEAAAHFDRNVTIINYESLHKISVKKYDNLVVDEAPKISAFPKKTKARKKLDEFIHPAITVVWLSGTPNIETSAQLFHQLSLSPRHSFSLYKKKGNTEAYHVWWKGTATYKTYQGKPLPGYGILGSIIRKAGGKEMPDYSKVKKFNNKFDQIVIKGKHNETHMNAKLHTVYIDMPDEINSSYHELKTAKCSESLNIEPLKPAQLLSKLHQLASGTYIDADDTITYLSNFKADKAYQEHPDAVVFYKYISNKTQLLLAGYEEDQLQQIDSKVMGIDMSHYKEAVIYSLTFSGQNFTQCISRLCNFKRLDKPNIYIYLSKGTVDLDIYEAVSHKKDMNDKFLTK